MSDQSPPADHFRVVVLKKGRERYALQFDDDESGKTKALRKLGEWAANPELDFTWYDAAVLSAKVRNHKPFQNTLEEKP